MDDLDWNHQKDESDIQKRELQVLRALVDGIPITEILADLILEMKTLWKTHCLILLYDPILDQFILGASSLTGEWGSHLHPFSNLVKKLCSNGEGHKREHLIRVDQIEDSFEIKEQFVRFEVNAIGLHPLSFGTESYPTGWIVAFHKENRATQVSQDLQLDSFKQEIVRTIHYFYRDPFKGTHLFIDPVTELYSRVGLISLIDQQLVLAAETHQKFALIYMDCDRFKIINERFGQLEGDRLLRIIGQRLRALIGYPHLVGRVNSDEFLILLKDVAGKSTIKGVLHKLQRLFEKPWAVKDQMIYLSACMGVVEYPQNGHSVDALLKRAEYAVMDAKKMGRNQIKFYQLGESLNLVNDLLLENDLYSALEKQEFRLYYQPQVDVLQGKVIGAEILIRWQHPKYGLLAPNEFIPILNETGMILPVGEWVLQKACEQQVNWIKKGYPHFSVSVNLSPYQFKCGGVGNMVRQALIRTGIDPKYLKLEITENMIVEDVNRTIAILNELSDLGVEVSVDDFGTGYSSLSYIKKFPIETLKIDRSFVQDLDSSPQNQAIVKAIIDMAHALEITVIAEGAETEQQITYLNDLGCRLIQGYYFSKPIPCGNFEAQFPLWEKLARELSLIFKRKTSVY